MKVKLSIPKPSTKTWKVSGKTILELFNNLNKHKWWGRYRSNPDHSIKAKDGVVTEFLLKAKPVITMPEWKDYGKATKPQQKSWNDMTKALQAHEDRHHALFEKEAKAWQTAMDAKGDLDKKKATAEWKTFLKETQKKQDAYDAKSKHGKNEGVILNDV